MKQGKQEKQKKQKKKIFTKTRNVCVDNVGKREQEKKLLKHNPKPSFISQSFPVNERIIKRINSGHP